MTSVAQAVDQWIVRRVLARFVLGSSACDLGHCAFYIRGEGVDNQTGPLSMLYMRVPAR